MKPDIRDAHVYGGIVICGLGAGMVSLGAGLFVVGLLLAYLGLRAT